MMDLAQYLRRIDYSGPVQVDFDTLAGMLWPAINAAHERYFNNSEPGKP